MPALVVLALGLEPTWALVISQVILSLGIPFALVPLVWLNFHREVMGEYADSVWILGLNLVVSGLIILLNLGLLWLSFTG